MSADLHHRISAAILAQLATADPASWTPPWHGADPLPRNALTGRRYRGLNTLALWCAARTQGFGDARWATYRQWDQLGAQVRRHQRGSLVLFYRDLSDRADSGETPKLSRTGEGDTAPRFVARAAHVFNALQVDNAPPATSPTHVDTLRDEPLPAFDSFVAATGARIQEGGNRASFIPATDTIHLPARTAFISATARAATLSHELVHWTGAAPRLARDLSGRFGTMTYAAEELVAELGAAFVLAELGLARYPHSDHAAYMANWLPLLRSDPNALATAATHGSRAADYLIALQPRPNASSELFAATAHQIEAEAASECISSAIATGWQPA